MLLVLFLFFNNYSYDVQDGAVIAQNIIIGGTLVGHILLLLGLMIKTLV
jgi:hypothetical protein